MKTIYAFLLTCLLISPIQAQTSAPYSVVDSGDQRLPAEVNATDLERLCSVYVKSPVIQGTGEPAPEGTITEKNGVTIYTGELRSFGSDYLELASYYEATKRDHLKVIRIGFGQIDSILFSTAVLGPYQHPDPAAAIAHADQTVSSPISKPTRIYVFGPENILVSQNFNEAKARIFSSAQIKKVTDLWKALQLKEGRRYELWICHEGKWEGIDPKDILTSDHALAPGDAIVIARTRFVQL